MCVVLRHANNVKTMREICQKNLNNGEIYKYGQGRDFTKVG